MVRCLASTVWSPLEGARNGGVNAERCAMLSIVRLARQISLPRFVEHPLRTALTVCGVMLGVAVLVAVVLVNRSIIRSIRAAVDDISGKVDLQVTAGSSGIDE